LKNSQGLWRVVTNLAKPAVYTSYKNARYSKEVTRIDSRLLVFGLVGAAHMPKPKTHFEQIPLQDVIDKVTKHEELKTEEKRPAMAAVASSSGSNVKTADRI
jgi:hypothetical protein